MVEGERIAKEVPKDSLVECYVSEDYPMAGRLDEVLGYDAEPVIVSSAVFRKMSDTQSPQGILCVCRKTDISVVEYIGSRPSGELRLLLLEGIQDPGNLGTMVRTAEGAGFDAIIADMNTVDVYNPKVTRSTMGSLFRIPVIYTQDLPGTTELLRKADVKIYAAHLEGEGTFNRQYGSRLAFLIGNEGSGLSDDIIKQADELIRIPMKGQLESLNAAVAAALLMYAATSDSIDQHA